MEDRLRLDFKMEVGEVTETLTVSGEVPLVESETSSLGQVIAEKSIQELPIKGRNVFDLVALTRACKSIRVALGVVASTGDNSAPLFVLSDISINGGRFRSNDYMLDGVSDHAARKQRLCHLADTRRHAEFKVMTNSFGPQFGRSGGGVINVVTKSGANTLQATVYEFFRNDRLQSQQFLRQCSAVSARGLTLQLVWSGGRADPSFERQDILFCRVPGAPGRHLDWGADVDGTHGCTTCRQLCWTAQPARTAGDSSTIRPQLGRVRAGQGLYAILSQGISFQPTVSILWH